jgi:hypothetical protein
MGRLNAEFGTVNVSTAAPHLVCCEQFCCVVALAEVGQCTATTELDSCRTEQGRAGTAAAAAGGHVGQLKIRQCTRLSMKQTQAGMHLPGRLPGCGAAVEVQHMMEVHICNMPVHTRLENDRVPGSHVEGAARPCTCPSVMEGLLLVSDTARFSLPTRHASSQCLSGQYAAASSRV